MTLLWALFVLLQTMSNTGSIAGIVEKSGTLLRQPLQNARLELTEGPGTPQVIHTNANGRFVFTNLSAGRYRLFVTKDGFLRADLKISLGRSQQVLDIDFRLEPAPTVSGWVQDNFGEPIANVLIEALRRGYDVRGKPTLNTIAASVTDDRGQYRIYWIDPGEYFFLAGSSSQPGGSSDAPEPGVPPTYFPGVSEPADAKPIRVEIGREVNGVDFRLRAAAMTPFLGFMTNAVTGRPVGATITLAPAMSDPSFSRYRAQSPATGLRAGEFTIPGGVAPGSYVATGRGTAGDLLGFARVTIRAGQLLPPRPYELRLPLSPPITLSGEFFADGTSLPDLRQTKISLTSIDAALPSPPNASPSPATQSGKFAMMGVTPGKYLVGVSDLPEDFYLKAARFGNVDVLEEPIDIQREPISPLQILLGSDGGRLDAKVFDRKEQPVPSIQVVLVPDAARRHRPDQYRVVMTDDDGRVAIRGIPPGEYKLLGWESLEPNAYLNSDFMKVYDDLGVRVRIVPGENAPVTIRAIPAEF